jgi:ribosomal protein S18 acetylase RimI-like enzyme
MTIERLTAATEDTLADINRLLEQLVTHYEPETLQGLQATVSDSHAIALVAKDDNRIVGMAFVYLMQTLQGKGGWVDEVVVDNAYRGQGLGRKLMEALIIAARENGATELELTSKPTRVAANALYQKIGFKQRETNVYKMVL